MIGVGLGQKDYSGLAGKRLEVSGIRQTTGTHVTLDYFGQVLLVEGNVALGHLNHAGTIGMTAGYRGTKICQAGRSHSAQIP